MDYHCNSCKFHTKHKTKYEKHNETKKHIMAINNDKSPLELTLILLANQLKAQEETIKEEPEEPDVDIDDIINHVFFLTINEYVCLSDDVNIEQQDWLNYVKQKLSYEEQYKIANNINPFELLKDTYKGTSESAMVKKITKLIPDNIIKINDVSRYRFSVYSNGEWLDTIQSTKKIEELIQMLQPYIVHLHNMFSTVDELYRPSKIEDYDKIMNKVHQGDITKNVLKSILWYYKN